MRTCQPPDSFDQTPNVPTAGAIKKKVDAEQAALLADVGASTYAVEGDDASWAAALQSSGTVPSMISVKASSGKSKRQLEHESFAAGEFHDVCNVNIHAIHNISSQEQER